ncbi:MAG: ABC transporter permease, partial [Spirochaetes bacterium]|nr:ABC transporter permease [Spirochaetota bacterium]
PTRLSPLLPELTGYLSAVIDDPSLSLRCTVDKSKFDDNLVYKYENGIYKGMRFDNYAKSSSVLEGPSVDGLVFQAPNVLKQERSLKHVGALARINAKGYYLMPLIIQSDYIPIAATHDSNGMITRMPEGFHYQLEKRLFFCYGNGFFTPYIPMQENSVIYRPNLLNGANDSGFPRAIGSTRLGEFSLNYYDRDTQWKYLLGGLRLLGSSPEKPGGEGFGYDRFDLASFDTIRTSLHDYYVLNESRLQALRERNIYNNSLELMHADTGAMIEEAMRAETNTAPNPTLARAQRTLALALAEHVYTPLRGIIDDMVKAVVILLLLTIPFAFAMERLVFNFTLITRQIAGFAGFFLGTFGVLYFVHPAFRLASTPMVIFLAFVIILLSGIVVYLIMNKFRDEVKSMQGMGSTVHSREAHRATAMAAVLIGVSGMRNRPLKTGLTAITVVLLTFTILVFASFTSKMGVRTTYRDRGAGVENRIEIHKHTLLSVEKEVRESLTALYGDRYHLTARNGVFYDITKNLWNQVNFERDLVLRNPTGNRLVQIEAIVGLMPGEVERVATLRALLPGFGAEKTPSPPLYLSKACARDLRVAPGQEVLFQHKRFTFAGFFDASRLQMAENLDGSKVLPPNYKKTVQQNALNASGDNAMDSALNNLDNNSFAWATADLTAIAPYDSLVDVEHVVNFITLLPKSPTENVGRTAERIARAFNYPVYAKDDAGIFQYFYTKTYSGSGMRDILIPLLIGGLIIFSSLLGSIVDREREIFTFSALGLSPPNVAALFFAESGVYAVIGGVGGYLVSQVVVKFLTLLASFGFMTAPEMNFSSFSSVFTILIVMTTIILSTIYPAVKAGRSANPGVNRAWKMPAPKNGKLSFKFPFTVSTQDFAGIISFLHEHFDNHADVAVGEFTVRDFRLTNKVVSGGKLERADIEAEVSLAPFDLGIGQHFRLSVVPTDLAGIDEVQVDLEKHSGTTTSWVRANRDFIDDLRNQFLIWRSLPAESVAKYRTQTEALA